MANELVAQELNVEVLPQDEGELKVIAQEKANFIMQNISQLCENLKEAKALTIESQYAKTDIKNRLSFGVFGKSRVEKQADLNTRAISLQNDAIAQLADLVQASIRFAAASAMLNQLMIKELAQKTKEGFINVYGELQQVDEDMKKHIRQIEYGMKSIEYGAKDNKQSTNRALWIVLGVAIVAIIVSAVAIFVVLKQ